MASEVTLHVKHVMSHILTKYMLGQQCSFASTWFWFIVTCRNVLQSCYNMPLLQGSIFYYQNTIFRKIYSEQKTNVLKKTKYT